MLKTKTFILKESVNLSYLGLLITVAVFAPLIKLQLVSGSIVNAVLIVSSAIFGLRAGILAGIIPSAIALSAGLLPVALAPMVPFIIMGNAVLVIVFSFLRNKSFGLGIISGALAKFLFLSLSGFMFVNFVSGKQIAVAAANMFGLTQLFTALAGGLIAWMFIKIYQGMNNL